MVTTKSSGSSRRDAPHARNDASTKKAAAVEFDLAALPPLSAREAEQFQKLSQTSDDDIDFSDAPALGEEAWKNAVRGKFYRPVKQQVTLRIDVPTLEWFRQQTPKGYQTDINRVLGDYVERQRKKTG